MTFDTKAGLTRIGFAKRTRNLKPRFIHAPNVVLPRAHVYTRSKQSLGKTNIVGIDHGFTSPLAYFEHHGLPKDWPSFLLDFRKHWPTQDIQSGSCGSNLAHVVYWQTNCTFLLGVEQKKGGTSVMPIGFLIFAHRYNPDGTFDTICSRCFQTIATVRDETELPKIESQHVCDQHILERFVRLNSQRHKWGTNKGQLR